MGLQCCALGRHSRQPWRSLRVTSELWLVWPEATGRLMQGGAPIGPGRRAGRGLFMGWPSGLHSMCQDQSAAAGQSGWGR
jgi:hypothetical protein